MENKNKMNWNSQQEQALRDVDRWFYTESKRKPIYRVFGYAGTGKSTLARHFASNIDGEVCYAAYTGKAADVMRKAGCHGAKTIHSLIYKAEEDEKGRLHFKLNRKSELKDAALLIIDECSMVDQKIGNHLLSFGVPILVLGDPAQLPPPNGAGFFTEAKPDNMLTEIHRQAGDNPIIELSKRIREGESLDVGTYGETRVVRKITKQDFLEADQVLVGRNATRMSKNYQMRRMLGHGDGLMPVIGDKLICLKNDSELGIYNGMMFRVDGINQQLSGAKSKFMHMTLDGDGYRHAIITKTPKAFFTGEKIPPGSPLLKQGQQFDYGYAITVHKSQGSQWDNVLIYDESWCFREEWKRWLYTAVTRAAEKFTLVVD